MFTDLMTRRPVMIQESSFDHVRFPQMGKVQGNIQDVPMIPELRRV